MFGDFIMRKTLLMLTALFFAVNTYAQNSDSLSVKQPEHKKEARISYESRYVTGDDGKLASSFQRATAFTSIGKNNSALQLAWDYRPLDNNSFVTLSIINPFKTNNFEIYLSDQGQFNGQTDFIEAAKFGDGEINKNFSYTYLLNPGVGWGDSITVFYDKKVLWMSFVF